MAIIIKQATPQDANAIIELIKQCYGNDCSDTEMYDAEILAKRIKNGKSTITIAVDGEHIVSMEVFGNSNSFSKTAYLKNKMTLPQYRGCGIGKKVADLSFAALDNADYNSAYALALTYNDLSQKILFSHGFVTTGLCYNSFLKSEDVPNSINPIPKRSHAIMVKQMKKQTVPQLFLPKAINEFAKKIYKCFGFNIKICNETGELSGKSELAEKYSEHHQNSKIVVHKSGSDLVKRINQIISSHQRNPLQTYNLYINIADNAAVAALNELTKQGFVFTGLKPLGSKFEYAVMYYSKSVEIHNEYITIYSEFKEIKEKIIELQKGQVYD